MKFVGKHEHSIDENGRIVLPSRFRSHFEDSHAYLSLGPRCVTLSLPSAYDAKVERLRSLVRDERLGREAFSTFLARTVEVRPDRQGRFVIPERLRNAAGLRGDVVVVGQDEEIEIWERQRWDALESSADEEIMSALERGLGV